MQNSHHLYRLSLMITPHYAEIKRGSSFRHGA
jgi:hypothetical protein